MYLFPIKKQKDTENIIIIQLEEAIKLMIKSERQRELMEAIPNKIFTTSRISFPTPTGNRYNKRAKKLEITLEIIKYLEGINEGWENSTGIISALRNGFSEPHSHTPLFPFSGGTDREGKG